MVYCTTTQVKDYLRMPDVDDDDNDLFDGVMIPAAQAVIDMATGRTFESGAATAKLFDAVGDVSEDGRTLYLGNEDLAELTSITNGDGTSISIGSVVTEPRRATPFYAIRIKDSAGVVWTYDDDPEDAISITGQWAYSVTAPEDVVHATVRLVAAFYKQRDNAEDIGQPRLNEMGVVVMPLGLPKDVQKYILPYKRLV